jgi:hypothetical protein
MIKPMNEMEKIEYFTKLNNYDHTFIYNTFINNNGENIDPSIQYNKKSNVNRGSIEDILAKLNKNSLINGLREDRLGKKIIKDIKLKGSIPLTSLINRIFFVQNAFKL